MFKPGDETYEEKFINTEFCNNGHQKQNEYRKKGLFTDIILSNVDGTEFPVHKIILVTQCPYFEETFQNEFRKSFPVVVHIETPIPDDIMEMILEYLYIGEINITLENSTVLNDIAKLFNLPCLEMATQKILDNILNIDSVYKILQYSISLSKQNLSQICLQFIQKNIDEFFQKYLQKLNSDEIKIIMDFDDGSFSQEFLYTNIVIWLKYNFENRLYDFLTLLPKIKFCKIRQKFKDIDIYQDTIIMNNYSIRKAILEQIFMKKILCLQNKINVGSLKTFDNIYSITNGWITKFQLPLTHPYAQKMIKFNKCDKYSVCQYNTNYIIISGGIGSNSCITYSPYTNTIVQLTSMKEDRHNHISISINNKIYILGGTKNNGSVEELDIKNDNSLYCKSLPQLKMYDFGVEYYGGSIYAFGGKSSKQSDSLTVQRFDTRENDWYTVGRRSPNMLKPKCVLVDNSIFCCTDYRTANIFDIRTNEWIEIALSSDTWPLIAPDAFDFLRYKEKLYFIGEFLICKNQYSCIRVYDLEKNSTQNIMEYNDSKIYSTKVNIVKLTH